MGIVRMLFGVFGVVIISSLPDPRVVHGHKYRVAGRPVFHDLNEGLKLLLCPEQHLIGVLLAHAPRLVAGVFFQVIVFDCVVENRRELRRDLSRVFSL